MDAAEALGSVLMRFAAADPQLPNGFAEHTTMGADALLALGVEPAAVVRWAAAHSPLPLDPASPVSIRRRALLDEMEQQAWDDVLRREVAALAPYVGAHLFHGLIRTAHAVRGLRAEHHDAALGELATGLAAWHAWAGEPTDRRVARVGATPSTNDRDRILDAAIRGAGACASAPTIVHIHAVTAPMAFELVADLLDDATISAAADAFERTHARHPPPPPSSRSTPPGSDRLTALLDHWDAHPAKLTEAALRGFTTTGDGVFLDAAAAIMGPWPTTTSNGSTPSSSQPGSR